MNAVKKLIQNAITRLFQSTGLFNNHAFLDARLQQRACDQTCEYIENKMMFVNSCGSNFEVLDIALKNLEIPNGLFLEFGVFSGRSINYIASKVKNTIHGFDSFVGLPEFWRDGFDKERFSLQGTLPDVKQNVRLHKGWFEQTIPEFRKEFDADIAFLHIDCDLYSSTVTILKELSKQIVPGTIIVFDEYFNYPGWQNGEIKAFKEFLDAYGIKYQYVTYNNRGEQVALKIIEKPENISQ